MLKNRKKLRQAILTALGVTALALGSATAHAAQTVYTASGTGFVAFGTGDVVGTLTIGQTLSTPAAAASQHAGGIYTWDGHNNTAMDPNAAGFGWGHNAKFYYFELAANADVTITETDQLSNPTNFNAAFTVWKTSGYTNPGDVNANGHSFDQVGTVSLPGINNATPWLTDPNAGGVTAYVGYANTGPSGWINGANKTVGNGGVGSGFTGSYTANTGDNVATLVLRNLPAGRYLIGTGSNLACGSFASNTLAACPATDTAAGKYILTVAATTATTAATAVPIPAVAVWLFAGALLGIGVIGRRNGKAQG